MKASIIILTYNQLEECTSPCLESIFANTAAGDFELILVDNASTDGTPAYLEKLAATRDEVHLQLNQTNRGYPGGNNDGLKLAQGDHLILMNNDVLVGPGWLDDLLRPFALDEQLGMVGPVSNSVGNEQQVNLPELRRDNFSEIAKPYCRRHQDIYFETSKLGFFCVAIKRSLFAKIGDLDECFGLGMFEDDDYCLRARAAGFKLAVTDGCFLYHIGSASFKKLERSKYTGTFQENRKQLVDKHQVSWTYSDLLEGYWERVNKELLCCANDPQKNQACLERIQVRFANMRGLIDMIRNVETGAAGMHGNNDQSQLIEKKQAHLMEISAWATGLKERLDSIEASYLYRACSILKRFGAKIAFWRP